jgi:hypothetical protein
MKGGKSNGNLRDFDERWEKKFVYVNEEPRRKQRGIKIPETRRIPSAASCGEYYPK